MKTTSRFRVLAILLALACHGFSSGAWASGLRQAPSMIARRVVGHVRACIQMPHTTAEKLPAPSSGLGGTFTTCQASISGDNVTITDVSMPARSSRCAELRSRRPVGPTPALARCLLPRCGHSRGG